MKEYKIELSVVKNIDKYNISYYENNKEVSKEFYAYKIEEPLCEIRLGYTKHPDSL